MRLWIGGAYQGKLAYLRSQVPEDSITYCAKDSATLNLSGKAVCGLHIWVRAALRSGIDPLLALQQHSSSLMHQIILCDSLGSGIVPLTREDRHWREQTGRVLQYLAQQADEVTEFLAGIPRRLQQRQTLTLLRHGITADNQAHRYCGSSDPALCPEGREALAKKHYPPAERYFTSPSRRAVETLHLLFGTVPYTLCPGMAECAFGEFEGYTHSELESRPEYIAWITDETGDISPPKGESRNVHTARIQAAARELLNEEFSSAVLLCHGGTVVRLMEGWFPHEKNFYEWQPNHGEGWQITVENGIPVKYVSVSGQEEAE